VSSNQQLKVHVFTDGSSRGNPGPGNGLHITIYTDSKYVCEAVEKGWVFNWVRTQFKDKKNADLWMHFLKLYKLHHIQFKWVKGHNGHKENERCDVLATQAADNSSNLLIDDGFESGLYN